MKITFGSCVGEVAFPLLEHGDAQVPPNVTSTAPFTCTNFKTKQIISLWGTEEKYEVLLIESDCNRVYRILPGTGY